MVRKHFIMSAAIVMVVAMSVRAQDIKSGICPSNVNNRYSVQIGDLAVPNVADNNPFASRTNFATPQYSPALVTATPFGLGAVGTIPISGDYILRTSIISLSPSSSFGLAEQSSGGILMPIEFGLRVPIVHSVLGTMDYTLYGETTAGLVLGMSYPTNGSFIGYSLPNSRFSTGASAYLGLGNTLRFNRYVSLYLNGGAGYFDLFSSNFMVRPNYFYPEISVGFFFNLTP